MQNRPLKFIIIGSGYRAKFYVRIARRYPSLFELQALLCRSEEKAEKIERELGCRATSSPEECESLCPDLVVIAVNKSSISAVAEEWIEKGFPVLLETPAAISLDGLERLWRLYKERGAKIYVAEQYHRYPAIFPGMEAIRRGIIGEPQTAYLSLAHDYHAASLLRRMLLTGIEDFSVFGMRVLNTVVETDSRYGAITDGRRAEKARDMLLINFSSGKTAIYDFSGLQYHSYIRSRHLTVRGDLGEWNDTELRYADNCGRTYRKTLVPAIPAEYKNLMTASSDDKAMYAMYSPDEEIPSETDKQGSTAANELGMDNTQDEFAIASLMRDIHMELQGKSNMAYPINEALEDAYIALKIEEALSRPGTPVKSGCRAWM